MFSNIRFLVCACLLVAACETTPEPVEMEALSYQAVYAEAEASGSIVHADRLLSQLITRTDLSLLQRADAQLLRAKQRQKFAYDLPGAVADYQAYLAAVPESPEATEISAALRRAQNDISAAQSRMARLQTLEKWFADKIRMGALDEAAARQRRSKITPTDLHTYLLREAGFICDASGGREPIHHFGPKPNYVGDLVWCDVTETSRFTP